MLIELITIEVTRGSMMGHFVIFFDKSIEKFKREKKSAMPKT